MVSQATQTLKSKSKAISVSGRGDAYGRETLGLPYFLDNRLTGGS
jgi:hypothetical protein